MLDHEPTRNEEHTEDTSEPQDVGIGWPAAGAASADGATAFASSGNPGLGAALGATLGSTGIDHEEPRDDEREEDPDA